MSDRAASLRAAAARKHADAIARAEHALRELDRRGAQITFQSVARQAAVCGNGSTRSPNCARDRASPLRWTGPPAGVPAAERASDASLRQRITTLSEENRRLRDEDRALKDELAIAYGQQRVQRTAL